ncbi:MAG: type IV pilus assembly protein PilM [Cyanobacteria bacterium KgW148]|nr:type IV pilus assembly protein PilM [Cyanobacteria bacterium KgW148]
MSFLQSLFSGGTKGIGIDINPDRVNMVELQKKGASGYKIAKFASEVLPEGVVEEGRINDPIQLGEVIRRLYTENRFGVSKVATAIPGRETVSRLIKVPAEIPPEELRDVVLNQEASLYLPFPREDADVDYVELETKMDDDGIERREILMVATPKEVTDTYTQAMEVAQLKMDVLEVTSFSLIRTFREELKKFSSVSEAVAIVDIEYESTEITIVVDGVPQFSRTVGIGTSQIQNAQLRSMNLPPLRNTELERIEQMTVPLQTMDTAGLGGGTGTPGEAAVLRVLSDLGDELRRSIDFYTSQTVGADVTQILIGGPGAAIDQLDEFFSQRLGITANQVDPLVALSVTSDRDYSRGERMSMAVVLGLGLREVG